MNGICLDKNYSTTRLLIKVKSSFKKSPEGENYKGEGGLRTKGYFKKNYPEKPLITIITVVFNGEKYLEETIQSVINQTYDNVEYIIIDGNSTDGTVKIIEKYEDRIDYWVSKSDSGVYDAMNKGVELSKGKWLNLMNCGDILFEKDTLSKINKEIKIISSKISFLYSDTQLYNIEEKRLTKKLICDNRNKIIMHQSCIYKKSLHKDYGRYLVKKGITISDYLFFNIVPNKYFKKVDNIISRYNINGISSSVRITFYQKLAVDLMFGNITLFYALIRILSYPLRILKYRLKKIISFMKMKKQIVK